MANLVAAGPRLPKNYRLVLDVVLEHGRGRHLTMGDVFAQAARRRPGIGYSTVYRGLVRLRELGLVSEVVLPGAAATYEPAAEPHAHFLCTRCGAIADVDYALPARVLRSVAAAVGCDIATGSVTFEGACAVCREHVSRAPDEATVPLRPSARR